MLIQSFIDNKTVSEILKWSNTQYIKNRKTVGYNGYFSLLDKLNDHPSCINVVRKKCVDLVNGVYQEPMYKDFINEVLVNGFINEHIDETVGNLKHLRCNILLQKPDEGGKLVIGSKIIDLNVGDMFVVDTSIKHAITRVKGSLSYKGIVFGFLCK